MPTHKANPIMQYFEYAHLPAHLKGTSQVIANVAKLLYEQLPDGPEKSSGLRKLLEAKDCFVRSALNAPNAVQAGELSDGYHSYNELYAHRMQLFAVVCHHNLPHAWKSALHHDGTMFDGYFIVGVNTPLGQFTYHYPMLHWNLFEVKELARAPEWDGHTADHVMRLHSLDGHIAQDATGIAWDLGKDITNEKMDETTFKKLYGQQAEGQLRRSHDTHDNYIPLRSRADQE